MYACVYFDCILFSGNNYCQGIMQYNKILRFLDLTEKKMAVINKQNAFLGHKQVTTVRVIEVATEWR